MRIPFSQRQTKAALSGNATSVYLSVCKLLHIEALLKAVNTPAGIHQFLLSGKERVAFGANFNPDVLLGRGSLDLVATGADNLDGLILWMDSLFHAISPLSGGQKVTKFILAQSGDKYKPHFSCFLAF
jgi:hypothetical protein